MGREPSFRSGSVERMVERSLYVINGSQMQRNPEFQATSASPIPL